MSIACPYCQFTIKLKGVKAGKYAPKCPKCAKGFSLTVSGDEGQYDFAVKGLEPTKPGNVAAPTKPRAAAAAVQTPPAKPRAPEPKPKPAPVPAPVPVPAAPAPEVSDATVAAISQVADDPDTTSGYVGGAAAVVGEAAEEAVEDAENSSAFAETEFHDSAAPQERTQAGPAAADDADFDVDEGEEAPPKKIREEDDIPEVLGGYEVVEQLGKGGMGTVFLARQVSLDRPVALKVMNPRWASDPVFVARFTREAYAAAQLIHHNVVQIYDIGAHDDFHFFSMEFVKGRTLTDLVKEKKKLDVEEAAGYILQAARGLKAAHDQGMVHRDVKPDNLMLNEVGVVKVTDLGLVKTPGLVEPAGEGQALQGDVNESLQKKTATKGSLSSLSSITNVGTAMGTPTYMAPEQGRNASTVDHRADIYSLGCTLYVMITGRAPFRGKSALEVMTKHLTEPVEPPERFVKRMPKELSVILAKMMAKKPEDRYADLGEVIAELEKFLGVSRVGPFSPSEEHADVLDTCVTEFNGATAGKLRSKVVPAYYAACALLTVACAFFSVKLAAGFLILGAATALFSFLVRGMTQKTYLFNKTREYVLDSDRADWLMWGVGFLIFVALMYMTGLLIWWLVFTILAGAVAAAFRVVFDRPLERQRQEPLENAEKLLKTLRLRGTPEEAIRQFVCKYSGNHWEEFYEALFGYEALLTARKLWSRIEGGKPRPVHASWRDPFVLWIDTRQKRRKELREKRHLEKVEREKLKAEGASDAEARAKAEQAAVVMVQAAAQIKEEGKRQEVASAEASSTGEETTVVPAAPPLKMQEMIAAAEQPRALTTQEKQLLQETKRPPITTLLFGPRVRFLLGTILLVFCFLWMNNNDLIPREDLQFDLYLQAVKYADANGRLSFLPSPVDEVLSGFNTGVAGLLLVLSALTRSGKMLFFLLLGVIAMLAGPLFVTEPIFDIGGRYVALLGGVLLAVFGMVFHLSSRQKA